MTTLKQPYQPLYPLLSGEEWQQLETETKQIFAEVFAKMLGDSVRDLLAYGMPYLTSERTVKKFILSNGLSPLRSDADASRLAYLLKAWTISNPKRGFHFLETFLQLLYPNNHKISQLWQDASEAYPTRLRNETDALKTGRKHWLTSRVEVEVTDSNETGSTLVKFKPELQSIIGARFLLQMKLLRELESAKIGIAAGFSAFQFVKIESVAVLPPN